MEFEYPNEVLEYEFRIGELNVEKAEPLEEKGFDLKV